MKNNNLLFINKVVSVSLLTSILTFSTLHYSQAYSQEVDWRANNLEGFKNPLIEASNMGLDTLVVRAIEAKGADNKYVNAKGKNGTTALIEAAYKNNLSTVEILLERGADITIADDRGETALSVAKKANNTNVIQLLQAHADKISAKRSSLKKPIRRKTSSTTKRKATTTASASASATKAAPRQTASQRAKRLNKFKRKMLGSKKVTKKTKLSSSKKPRKIKKQVRRKLGDNKKTKLSKKKNSSKLGQIDGYVYNEDGFIRPDISNKIKKENEIRSDMADTRQTKSSWKNYGMIALGVGVVGGGVAALASGGGGSSSGGSSTSSSSTSSSSSGSTSSSSSSGSTLASSFDTAEFQSQPALNQVNAITSYDRGHTGSGIVVAVLDNGVDRNHPDLAGKIDSRSFDFIFQDSDPFPSGFGSLQSQGTSVAGIIAANKNDSGMHGLAYDSSILALRAGTSGGAYSPEKLSEALDYAVANGARVVNNSYSSSFLISNASSRGTAISLVGINSINSYLSANINGAINVWAAGDGSNSQPSLEAGLPARIDELKGKWIAVASVNNNNEISSFSNRCGSAAEWCIVAPGENINSTLATGDPTDSDNDGYGTTSSTTKAAPIVTAAAAILLEAFPTLTPEQAVELLLSTATDLGDAGTDAIYGRGLLNLDAATAPQGSLKVPSSSKITGSTQLLQSSFISTGGAFGDAVAKSNVQFTVLDQYNRSYQADLASSVSPQSSSSDSHQLLLSFGKKYVSSKATLNKNTTLEIAERDAYIPRKPSQNDFNSKRASFVTLGKNTETAVNYNVPMEESFRFNAANDYNKNMIIGKHVLTNPFLSFAGDGVNVTSSHKLNKKSSFKVAAFHGSKEDDKYGEYTDKSTGVVGEISYAANDNSIISLQAGVMNENNSFLGTKSEGAFAVLGNNKTFFYGVAASHKLTNRISLFGTISAGSSFISGGETDSIVRDISMINSYSYSIGATYTGAVAAKDTFGFAVSQPLKVSSGSSTLFLPSSTDRAGNISYSESRVGLAPSGKEIDIEAFYALPINDNTSINTGAILRKEPGHIADADDEGIFMLKVNHNF